MSTGSRRERLKSEWRQRSAEWRHRQRSWALLSRPEGRHRYFDPPVGVKPFDPTLAAFDLSQAWWLGELCRFVYTADHREQDREAHVVDRQGHLAGSPFDQLVDIHRYATHVALFRVGSEQRPEGSVLCFRGTTRFRQWVLNLSPLPVPWKGEALSGGPAGLSNCAWVHQGFSLLFDNLWPKIEPHLDGLPEPLILAGHSLGGALALQASDRCQATGLYTFGSPRVGDRRFCERINSGPHHRLVNGADVVPLLPETGPEGTPFAFLHHGREIHLGAPAATEGEGLVPLDAEAEIAEEPPVPASEMAGDREGATSTLQRRMERAFREPGLPRAFGDHLISSYLRNIKRAIAGQAPVLDGDFGSAEIP